MVRSTAVPTVGQSRPPLGHVIGFDEAQRRVNTLPFLVDRVTRCQNNQTLTNKGKTENSVQQLSRANRRCNLCLIIQTERVRLLLG
jgi:aspartate carbamoyltransferase regulatory subunit